MIDLPQRLRLTSFPCCQEAAARIEALEAALREIAAIEDQSWGEDWCEINGAREIARAALEPLAPEQDK